jgi:hypothetical protein
MVWARGHQADWDLFAEEAGDPAWRALRRWFGVMPLLPSAATSESQRSA